MGASGGQRAARATFTSLLTDPTFAPLYLAHLLSLLGDQAARVALAILVYDRTSSPAIAAFSYGVTLLPWLLGVPLLSGLADRWPRRQLMIVCDVLRFGLVAAMVVPGQPVPVLLALIATVALLAPPFEAARAALVADVVKGERYATASALTAVNINGSQMFGLAAGGALVAGFGAQTALGVDAATFLASAGLLLVGRSQGETLEPVRQRRARERSGFAAYLRLVLGRPDIRLLVTVTWVAASFAVVPEALAVVYARSLHRGDVAVGLLTAAAPTGATVATVLLGRYVPPAARLRWFRPLALLSTAPLVLTVMHPGAIAAGAIWFVSGAGAAMVLPMTVKLVQSVPSQQRGGAFAIMQGGLQLLQGCSMTIAGAVAQHLPVHFVIAGSGAIGAVAISTWTVRGAT